MLRVEGASVKLIRRSGHLGMPHREFQAGLVTGIEAIRKSNGESSEELRPLVCVRFFVPFFIPLSLSGAGDILGRMYLFFDTETTGLPRNYKAPAYQLENWPRMIQLAWVRTDEDGQEISAAEYIIKPDGFRIPWRSWWVHGISTRKALREGVDLDEALDAFVSSLDGVSVLVAHNMAFDEKILGAELLRSGRPNVVETRRRRCTMQLSKHFCGLYSVHGYKWPTLQELHVCLFRRRFRGAHDALTDVRACVRCFFELKQRKIIP